MIRKIISKIKGKPEPNFDEEWYVLDLIHKEFGNMSSVFEAGGHRGTDTVRIAQKWPNAKVYSFEPVPYLFKDLQENTKNIDLVSIFPIAIGKENGEIEMHVSSGDSDGSSSIMKPKDHLEFHPDVKFEEQIKVPLKTLDDWAQEEGVKSIDFMWLDMQGAEFDMLSHSKVIFPTVKIIFSEVSLIETYEGVQTYDKYKAFLEEHGFEVYKEYMQWKDMGNVVFVKSDLLKG